jgi:hypothetical protein
MGAGQTPQEERRDAKEGVFMNTAMIIELIVFFAFLIAGVALASYLRRQLEKYDGMGEVKKNAPGKKKPPSKTLGG